MEYKRCIPSPLGQILVTGNSTGITGLWFVGEMNCPNHTHIPEAELAVFNKLKIGSAHISQEKVQG